MNDKLRRQQRQFMVYNLVAFTLIFSIFGVIVYQLISRSLFSPVEASMRHARSVVEHDADYIQRELMMQQEDFPPRDVPWGRFDKEREGFDAPMSISMRVQIILRDHDGVIQNPRSLGRLYFDDFLDDIPHPDSVESEWTRTFQVGSSHYISTVFPLTDNDGTLWSVQILSNIDGERSILDNFVRVLVVCIVAFVLLSISASYLLSRMTMAPVIRAWERQTEFVADASHELRTPLTIIQNKLEAMLRHPKTTVMENAGSIGVTLAETRRLTKLTADLMTLARADSSETQLEKEPFPLDQLIETVCEPYREMAELQDKTMTLHLDYGRDLNADRSRIHQLMVILLDNALKYTAEGDEIEVRTRAADGRVILEVADTGIGIPEESRERIFDRFYRADKARSRESGGSGLGLSIAKWIVDTHGGTVEARRRERGTTFRVTLKP